ncbi:hypothetical protein [Streptomyces sp. NPDC058665]|uniref:hypothetical protein n=1 Tax=Streptomyces sp. NPDC058665 TaxID=3346586 RepID=UPI0036545749
MATTEADGISADMVINEISQGDVPVVRFDPPTSARTSQSRPVAASGTGWGYFQGRQSRDTHQNPY